MLVISEEEQIKLIMLSSLERYILCSFGPSYVALRDLPENEWAIELVRKWREQNND